MKKRNSRLLKVFAMIIALMICAELTNWYFRHKRKVHRLALLKEEREIGQKKKAVAGKKDPDDLVVLKNEHPASLQDEKDLKGRSLWVSAGGQMIYYPFNGHSVDFGHPQGALQGAQKIVVKDAVEEVVPASAATRIPQGDGQVLLVFNLAESGKNANQDYAVAVGDKEGTDVNLLTDQIFFYDDPHTLYAYWGPQVWQAIDQHKAMLGMSEHQVQMALGQVSTPRGDMMGDRAVEFDDQNKQWLVTFVNGKATEIRDLSQ